MIYKPSKKEIQQLANLNKGYILVKEGLKIIKANLNRQDSEVEMQSYKMSKNFDKIIARIKKVLERNYIDKEFLDIINGTKKPKKRKPKKDTKTDSKKKKIIKKRKPKGKK